MILERRVLATFGAATAVSAYISYVLMEEEFTRRYGLKGTEVIDGPDGAGIEYTFSSRGHASDTPVVVLESGLGAPLESWDWVADILGDHFRVLRYHRSGYWRSKTACRPGRALEYLLRHCAPDGDVILCGHSMGALAAMNAFTESEYLRKRTRALHIIDGTDAVLLEEDRASKRRVGRYNQDTARRLLGAALGTTRWLTSPAERELEYRPDIQRAYLASMSSPQMILTARREYLTEPTHGQEFLATSEVRRLVISAGNNTEQQKTLGSRIGADFYAVPGAGHRSIIAKRPFATQVARIIQENS